MSDPTMTRDSDGHITIDWHTTDNELPKEPIPVSAELIVTMINAFNESLPPRLDPTNRADSNGDATPSAPIYRKVRGNGSSTTQLYFIVCDEGWRDSIVCSGMYEWTANWLLEVLARKPFAPEVIR